MSSTGRAVRALFGVVLYRLNLWNKMEVDGKELLAVSVLACRQTSSRKPGQGQLQAGRPEVRGCQSGSLHVLKADAIAFHQLHMTVER